jgi:hypothetical protein
MIYSVFGSIILTLIVYAIPGLNAFFGMYYIDGRGWALVVGGSVFPIIVEEITKWFYRRLKFGERTKAERYSRN